MDRNPKRHAGSPSAIDFFDSTERVAEKLKLILKGGLSHNP
jgi:hypothetical protein